MQLKVNTIRFPPDQVTVRLLLLTALTLLCYGRDIKTEFVPVESICDRCRCFEIPYFNGTTEKLQLNPVLDCSDSNITRMLASWPDFFDGKQVTLANFCLSGNNIHSLQQLPATNVELTFGCRHCNLTTLASGVFSGVPHISHLDLSWNQLTGDEFQLDIFREISTERGCQSIALSGLVLKHNLIESFNESLLAHMAHLRMLSLAYNPLGQITEAFGFLSQLEYLDLSYTGLADIPRRVFQKIIGLKELQVQGNRFTVVPNAIALFRHTLTSLNIGENPIQILNDKSFGLDCLYHLNISGMEQLRKIATGTFTGLRSLRRLICNHNRQLRVFDMNDLKGLTRLYEIDLSSCGLQHLRFGKTFPNYDDGSEVPHMLPELTWLNLNNNSWHCDCDLHESIQLIKHILTNRYGFFTSARCETPYYLAAISLIELGDQTLLRPRAIVMSILSVGVILLIGVIMGFAIVCIHRKRMAAQPSPVRYTTVRGSTT